MASGYDGTRRRQRAGTARPPSRTTPGPQYALGQMYQGGRGGLAKDPAEAARWARKGLKQLRPVLPTVPPAVGGEGIFLVPGAPEPTGLELSQLTPGEVRAIQRSLGWLGFWSGPVDGEVS